MGTHAFVNARYQHEFGHTGPCTRWEAHFPPRWGTAAAFRRHLRPADIRKTCGRRGPCAPAFVVWASGRPSRGGRARARAREHEMAAGAGRGRGARPLAQAHGAARVPAFPPTRAGTQRAGAKARSAAALTERLAARSGLDRTTGAGAGLAGTARSSAAWGVVRRACPAPRRPSTAVTASRARQGRAGRTGAQAPRWRRPRDGLAPPFCLARRNGGAGRPYPGAEGRAPGPLAASSGRAPHRGGMVTYLLRKFCHVIPSFS